MHTAREIFQEAMALEIKGYVLKDSAVDDIVLSIRAVAAGRPFLSPVLSAHLLHRQREVEAFDEEHPGLATLTPAERRILKLTAADRSSKEIATELFISLRTVEAHRTNICGKLGLQGPLALVRFALTNKLALSFGALECGGKRSATPLSLRTGPRVFRKRRGATLPAALQGV